MSGTFEGVGSLQFTPDNKHAYAYSGENQISTTEVIALNFNTNSEYIKGRFIFGGSIKYDNIGNGTINAFQIRFNNVIVATIKVATNTDDQPSMELYDIIIPPFSNVVIGVIDSASTSAGFYTTTTFTGKVKGAIQQTDLEAISDGSNWIKK
jgi:hypothetical protein